MDTDNQELPSAPDGYKYMPCRYCGETMLVGVRKRNSPGHLECGVSVAYANVKQIHEKKGPYYDKWLAGQRAYLERLGGGGTPGSDKG